eukprot:s223_g64.t1
MGPSADGAMPAETVAEMPVASVAAAPVLTATVPEADASRPTEVAEVENAEPSASRSETEKRGHVVDETPEEVDSEAVRAAKRARQDMTQAEVEEEGLTDHEVVLKCLRLVQSSLEYTARQAAALKTCQEQLGEIGSAAYHGESCQRYALAAITAAAGNVKALTWQMTGSRQEEKVSCKSLIQQILTNSGKTVGLLTKLSESLQKQAEQNAERDKHFSEVLLQIQGQIADNFARGAVPAATPITPNTGAAPPFPPTAPVMPGYAASVIGGSPVGIGGYGGPQAMPTAVPGSYGAPAPPPPSGPAPSRSPITLQLRQADGSILQRQASPTPFATIAPTGDWYEAASREDARFCVDSVALWSPAMWNGVEFPTAVISFPMWGCASSERGCEYLEVHF